MTSTPQPALERLSEMGFELPPPEPTIYGYIPVVVHQRIAYLAGQVPKRVGGGLEVHGTMGVDLSLADAQRAAQLSTLHALSWVEAGAGGLDNVERVLRMDCYIATVAGVEELSNVADAASALLVDLYGDAGRHPRAVIGVVALPRKGPVLIELTFALHRDVPE